MRPGTIVRLPDGREGTVVYHGLDGYGIMWGRVAVNVEEILACNGGTVGNVRPSGLYPWFPEAMLRDPYPSAEIECVGEKYEIVEVP